MAIAVNLFRHTPRERKALAWIYQQISPDQFWLLQDVEASLEKSSVSLWYAHENFSWHGFLLAESLDEQAELFYLFVDPAFRGQGIGGRLLKNWLRILKSQNVKKAFLEVRISNQTAQSLYESHGFKKVGLRRAYYRDGEDAFVYEKELMC